MYGVRRGRNKVLASVKCCYTDFAKTTSIHGLKYTVGTSYSLCEKLLWILIVLFGMLGAGYIVNLFWQRYTANPIRTTILTNFAPTATIAFPAITFCSTNKIMRAKFTHFVNKLDTQGHNKSEIFRILPQIMTYISSNSLDYDVKDLNVLQEIFLQNDFSHAIDVIRKLSQGCNELLVRCKWKEEAISCREIFKETLTKEGICCSFNYNIKKPLETHTDVAGFTMGLTVLMNPMISENHLSNIGSDGIKVYVHDPRIFPTENVIEKILPVGRVIFLQLSATKLICSEELKVLPIEHRRCIYSDDYPLKYFSHYSNENCETECEIKYYLDKCECLPFYYKFEDRDVCNVTKIPCLDKKQGKNSSTCNCITECEEIVYKVDTSDSKLISGPFLTSTFLKNVTLTPDMMLVSTFFGSQIQTVMKRDALTSKIYLICML